MVIPGISRSSQLAAVGAVVFTLVLQVHAATALERVEVGKWQSGDPCPDVLVLGARGSGQEDGAGGVSPGSPTLGVGEEVYRFAGYLAGVLEPEGLAVAVLPNAYPAVPLDEAVGGDPDYFDSVEMGAVAVEIYVALVASQCGEGTRVVVAGYSQGADVSRAGTASLDAQYHPRIAALVLFADPRHDPAAGGYHVGSASPDHGGVLGRTAPPAWVVRRTVQVCVEHDVICQSDNVGEAVANYVQHAGAVVHSFAYREPANQILTALTVAPLVRAASGATCFGLPATVVGTPGDDALIGTDGDDVIVGGAGDDTIRAGGGADVICPGPADGDPPDTGADDVQAGSGDDYIAAGDGPSIIDGGAGRDYILGGAGDDRIDGSGDADYLDGGAGADEIDGGSGDDYLTGGAGDDILRVGLGVDYVDGGAGDDRMHGPDDPDGIDGDYYDAGEGDDAVWGSPDGEYVTGGPGHDRIESGGGDDHVEGGDGHDELRAGDGDDYLAGDDGDDHLYGGDGDDYLDGGAGDDGLWGGDGRDHLDGGAGNDELVGGGGLDYYDAGDGDDALDAVDQEPDERFDCGAGTDALAMDAPYDDATDELLCEDVEVRLPGDTNRDGTVRVAVLGDSYIAGVGGVDPGEPYDAGTDTPGNRCRRTSYSWGPQIAERLRATGDDLLFAACNGATSLDVTSRGQESESGPGVHGSQPQVTTLRDWSGSSPADIVLLSIGGNDVGFAGLVSDCGIGRCEWFEDGRLTLAFQERYRLVETYRAVLDAARVDNPDAELWVSNYPNALSGATCGAVGYSGVLDWVSDLGIDSEEQAFLRDGFLETLNESVAWAAAQAGAHLIDLEDEAAGHELCSSEPYFNGVSTGFQGDGPWVVSARTAHPNKDGYAHFADVIWDRHRFDFGAGNPEPSGGSGPLPTLTGSLRLGPDPVSLQDTAPAEVLFQPGATVHLRVVDAPPADYRLVVRSLPRVLAEVTVPASGAVDLSFEVPASLAPHSHWLTLETADGVPALSAILQVGPAPGCELEDGDADADGDRIPDRCDSASSDGPLADADSDGVVNRDDNCSLVANPGQADIDGDRLGDACDPSQGGDPTSGYIVDADDDDPPTCSCRHRGPCWSPAAWLPRAIHRLHRRFGLHRGLAHPRPCRSHRHGGHRGHDQKPRGKARRDRSDRHHGRGKDERKSHRRGRSRGR
ncbi:MAG: cutinase family protein [Solirubrobacterales bacterium]|nr:cutinase family protein [Solirubrobacterales bacterium]